ncbi:unnamed protein product, partial [Thlaspi arvense]
HWTRPEEEWIKCNYDGAFYTNTMEAKAGWNCWNRGLRNIIFEGDYKSKPDLINGTILNFHDHNWIREARFWRNKFGEVKFQWTKRANNQPADRLAKSCPASNAYFIFHFFSFLM